MELEGITAIGKNEYIIKEVDNLFVLSSIAYPGSKAICVEDGKVYICTGNREWVTL